MYPTVGQELFDHFFGAKAVSMPLTLTTAMVSLVGGGIVDLFPKLRFGLLETGCGWLPYWIERMDEMHERGEKDPRMYEGILSRKTPKSRIKPSELFTAGRMVVSCEPGEIMLPAVVAAAETNASCTLPTTTWGQQMAAHRLAHSIGRILRRYPRPDPRRKCRPAV